MWLRDTRTDDFSFQPPSFDKTFMHREFMREREPDVPLLDDPLTNIDDRLRPHHFGPLHDPGPGTVAAEPLSALTHVGL